MHLALQLLAALALDLCLGDPRWFPHPVRLMGRLALALEEPLRRRYGSTRTAGVVAAGTVVGVTVVATGALLLLAKLIHPLVHDLVSVLMLWTTVAARDLGAHAVAVEESLRLGDLDEARRRVGFMVGRDTEQLDEGQVARAAVESVAENTADGVTAPIFFAVIAGPLGAMAYKAINTLDSTFGYKNSRYREFGWASARLDDLANWLPARLTGAAMTLAAGVIGGKVREAWRIMWRDHACHASPNSGWTEAAMAGALGVRLGGPSSYEGVTSEKPFLGDPGQPLGALHIGRANRLMQATVVLFLVLLLGVRWLLEGGA